jgi:hypothetical protein
MQNLVRCAHWAGAGLMLVISPAIVVFGAPFAFGGASGLAETAWLAPAALLVAAAVALNAQRRHSPQLAKSMT